MRDPQLSFLSQCSNDDLEPLVGYLLSASTNTLDVNEKYKAHAPNHHAYVDVIETEIREFGGNSFVNLVRGCGVPYEEIVRDVADKLGVKHAKEAVDDIELKIVAKIFDDSVKKMSPEERKGVQEEFRAAGAANVDLGSGKGIGILLAQGGVQLTGFLAYRITVIVANAVAKAVLGRGLSFAGNAALTRMVGLAAGPIGWAISGVWTAVDLAGPAYRVTIPVVCHVALLRQKMKLTPIGEL